MNLSHRTVAAAVAAVALATLTACGSSEPKAAEPEPSPSPSPSVSFSAESQDTARKVFLASGLMDEELALGLCDSVDLLGGTDEFMSRVAEAGEDETAIVRLAVMGWCPQLADWDRS